MRHHPHHGRKIGFTLVELAIALALGALLAALGWPLLTRQRAWAAVSVATHQTLGALHAARQRSLSSGHAVTVCPSQDGRRCGFGSPWWMAFENRSDGIDSMRDADEPLLQRWQVPAGVLATGTRGYATYQPATRAAATLTFRFCHQRHPEIGRSVIVSQTGRPRVSQAPASTASQRRCR